MPTNSLFKLVRGKGKPMRLPPHADYSDVVTDEHLARIREAVPEDEHKDGEVKSGPAW